MISQIPHSRRLNPNPEAHTEKLWLELRALLPYLMKQRHFHKAGIAVSSKQEWLGIANPTICYSF